MTCFVLCTYEKNVQILDNKMCHIKLSDLQKNVHEYLLAVFYA